MSRTLDRLVGLALLTAFGPCLLFMSLLLRAAWGGRIFESRLRVDNGTFFRTRRFKVDDREGRLAEILKQYRLDDLPVLLDCASGQARLVVSPACLSEGVQKTLSIRAPRAKSRAQPKTASTTQITTMVE
jgi:hypothetical protein